jgi:hypothetical protein
MLCAQRVPVAQEAKMQRRPLRINTEEDQQISERFVRL